MKQQYCIVRDDERNIIGVLKSQHPQDMGEWQILRDEAARMYQAEIDEEQVEEKDHHTTAAQFLLLYAIKCGYEDADGQVLVMQVPEDTEDV